MTKQRSSLLKQRPAAPPLRWPLLLLLLLMLLTCLHLPNTAAAAPAARVPPPAVQQQPPKSTAQAPQAAAAAGAGPARPPGPAAQCKLSILGSSSPSKQQGPSPSSTSSLFGLRKPLATTQPATQPPQISLSCTGTPVTIAAAESVASILKKSAKGVEWDPKGCDNLGCLLTICGSSSVVFQGASVLNVRDEELSAAVCVGGSSAAVFQGGVFSGSSTSQGALLVLGEAAVSLRGVRVANNTAQPKLGPMTLGGGVLLQEKAQASITDCVFSGNRAVGNVAALGAAVAAQDQAVVRIRDSVFQSNAVLAPAAGMGAALGGALYAESAAVLDAQRVRFVGNSANGAVVSVGGAVCVMHNVTLRLSDCVLSNNTATSQSMGVGGALAALNHTVVELSNTTLALNKAQGKAFMGAGGALLADNHARVTVLGSRFVGNTLHGAVVGAGGAINAVANVTLMLRDTVVSDNVASSGGPVLGAGIACLNTTHCILEDSLVTRNNATSLNMPAAGGGIGVYDQAFVHLRRCIVSHNWARGGLAVAGGGIMAQGNDTKLVVDNCTFENNTAAAAEFTGSYAGGGAVGAQGPAIVSLEGGLDTSKAAKLEQNHGYVVLRDSRFLHNHVAGIAASTGGAVFAGDGSVHINITSCVFVANVVGGIKGFVVPPLICCGGAVAVQEHSVMLVNSSVFESNSIEGVRTCGGAACAQNGGRMAIVGSRFAANHANGSPTCGGGACATNKGHMDIRGCVLEGNSASGLSNGGGACATVSSRLSVAGTAFRHNVAGWAGGAVGVGDACVASISRCSFENNTAAHTEMGCGGAVSVAAEAAGQAEHAECSIDSSSFVRNSALGRKGSGGGVYCMNAALNISNCVFTANVAQQGGGLGGSGLSWDVRHSSFSKHSIPGPGGAVFTAGGVDVVVVECSITHNRASEGGGLYAASSLAHSFKLLLLGTNVTHNDAQSGGGLSLKAGATQIGPGTTVSHNHASQQAGGIGWVGSSGRICSYSSSSSSDPQAASNAPSCKSFLNLSCAADVSDNQAGVAGGGLFLGEAFDTPLGDLGPCVDRIVHNNSAAFGEPNVFRVSSVCRPGEVSKGGWCEQCLPGMYAFDPQADKCEICPQHAVCLGGAVILPESGYWHSTNNSTQIHACPNGAACNHSLDAFNARAGINWQCATGYEGRVCGSCAPSYGFTSPFRCGRCMSASRSIALYMTSLLCLGVFLCLSTHRTFIDNKQQRTAPRVSDTLKSLVLYFNYLVIFSSIRVEWPKSLSVLYIASNWLLSSASGQVLSLDCMLPHKASLPLAVQRQLVYLLVPLLVTLAVLLALAAVWALPAVVRRHKWHKPFCASVVVQYPTAVLVALYLYFPGLVRVAWNMFACLPLDTPNQPPYAAYAIDTAPHGYWVQDMSQACYEGWHLSWGLGLGLPAVLIFCVGIPVALFALLAVNRNRLASPDFQKHFGFLYADYTRHMFWWEAVVAARTVLLVAVAVFSSVVGPFYGVVMFVSVIHLSLFLQLSLRPFAFTQMHHIQLGALAALDITGCVALTFFTVDLEGSAHALWVYKEVAGALVLLVHAVFLAWCVWVMVAGMPLKRMGSKVAAAWRSARSSAGRFGCRCARMAGSCCHSPGAAAGPTAKAVLPPVGPAGGVSKGGTPDSSTSVGRVSHSLKQPPPAVKDADDSSGDGKDVSSSKGYVSSGGVSNGANGKLGSLPVGSKGGVSKGGVSRGDSKSSNKGSSTAQGGGKSVPGPQAAPDSTSVGEQQGVVVVRVPEGYQAMFDAQEIRLKD